jgi:hypothetical protein
MTKEQNNLQTKNSFLHILNYHDLNTKYANNTYWMNKFNIPYKIQTRVTFSNYFTVSFIKLPQLHQTQYRHLLPNSSSEKWDYLIIANNDKNILYRYFPVNCKLWGGGGQSPYMQHHIMLAESRLQFIQHLSLLSSYKL